MYIKDNYRSDVELGGNACATVTEEPIKPPVFVMDSPNFLGLPTQEGEQRRLAYDGARNIDIPLRPCYVHGALQHRVGYDIAMLASGHIRDVDEQCAVLVDAKGESHNCMILSMRLPHVGNPTRAAFIIDPVEKESVRKYLANTVSNTSSLAPHPIL